MYQVTLGKWHFWLSMVGTNLTFFAMILLGLRGCRVGTPPPLRASHRCRSCDAPSGATVGALILLVGQMIFVWNFVQSWLEGRKVEDGDPWDLADDDLTTAE